MKRLNQFNNQSRAARSGFTLIELMVVIVIIAILMALILPAINGVRRNARNTQVLAEITRLETAISNFKNDFGIEPWDAILFDESGTWSDSNVAIDKALKQSRSRLRRLWPQFSFGAVDLNGDSNPDILELTGPECLVFFLGGMRQGSDVIGFSKNPLAPFSTGSQNRTPRYYEFDSGRLVDADGDGMFEYRDSLPDQQMPFHFASSNNGEGYSASVFHYLDQNNKPWKRDSHQIISPGFDGQFYDTATTLPLQYTQETDLSGTRRVEADNITNFAGGTLN